MFVRNPPPISTRYCTAAVLIVLYNCIVLSGYNTTQVQAFSSGDPSHLSGTSTLIILVQRECHANDVPNNIGVLHTYIPRMLLVVGEHVLPHNGHASKYHTHWDNGLFSCLIFVFLPGIYRSDVLTVTSPNLKCRPILCFIFLSSPINRHPPCAWWMD